MKKRWISLLLIACMVLALLPTAVFADGTTHTVTINAGFGGKVSTDGVNWSDSVQIEVEDGETIGDRVQYKPDVGFEFDCVLETAGARSFSAGRCVVVVDQSGGAWTAGSNRYGMLGRATDNNDPDWQLTKVEVSAKIKAAAASRMDHTVLLDEDGHVWTAGSNQYGQLGRSENAGKQGRTNGTFERIEGDGIDNVEFIAVAAGEDHTVLLDKDGHVWTAGNNRYGQLGSSVNISTKKANPTFTKVTAGGIENVKFVAIAAGCMYTVLLDKDGNVWTMGRSYYGSLGRSVSGSFDKTAAKAYIVDEDHPKITAIAAGQYHTLLLDNTGAVWGAGNNLYKAVDNTSTMQPWKAFYKVNTGYIPNKIVKIAAGDSHSILIDETGAAYLGGYNDLGQLGQADTTSFYDYLRPVGDAQNASIVAADGSSSYSILMDSNGNLWTAGSNENGQLCRRMSFGNSKANPTFEIVSAEFGADCTFDELKTRTITSDCTFTFRFKERVKIEVRYELNGGAFVQGYLAPGFYYQGEESSFKLPEKDKVIKSGYTLKGWGKQSFIDYGINLVCYYAEYTKNYKITYAGMDGATLGQDSPTELLETDKNLVIPNPTKTGYSFKGWLVNGTGEPQKDLKLNGEDFSADLTLTAEWEITQYKIEYELDGGSTDNAGGYNVTDKITLTPPTKTGYTFTGWSGTDLVGKDNMTVTIPEGSTGNRKYTAHWEVTKYTITYDLDSGTADNPEEYTIESADITLNTPTRDGYTFTGWSGTDLDGEANMTVTIPEGSTGDREYTAHWKQNVKPAPDLPWWAGLLPALDDELPFTDVQDGDWFYDDVCYVYKNGLMNGTSATKFSPSASTTRGMVLTILARMEGVNTAGTPWYAAGRDWAVANGISDGMNMEAPVTREQLAAILYRYASFKGRDAATLERELSAFADAGSVSGWALDAMQWAVGTGLISGSNGLLRPQSNASRAEVAAILARFAEYIG